MSAYQPKTGAVCDCKAGRERDNCPKCEGTGEVIDFAAIRARPVATKINFRTSKRQIVNLPFSGVSIVDFIGVCPVTGTRLYECNTGNDPRGPLGIHAATVFVAAEYGMTGPDLNASWIACNNDRASHERALAIAKTKWMPAEKRGETVNTNNNCDGSGPCEAGEVRVLTTGGQSNAILCRECFRREIEYRRERNRELGSEFQFELPAWGSLRVYGQEVGA
jgi:hypothetical protein